MERTMSVEDKIRRAEEIYNRRRENQQKIGTAKVSVNNKKDIKLFKKMFVQIIVCLAIYSAFYIVKNNNYIFSEDLLNRVKEVLAYDVDFANLYSKATESLKNNGIIPQENSELQDSAEGDSENQENKEDNAEENGIGGAEESNEENNANTNELSQMEQDALDIKNSISFINPIEGTITSTFGWRTPTTSTVPKYHTGLDIANVSGTPIHSATDGEVILASSQGDYRQSFKSSDK